MKRRKKYFVLNKSSDFEKGRCDAVRIGDGFLTLSDGQKYGVYYSKVFDSREKQMVWNRMQIVGSYGPGHMIQVKVYASESRIISAGGQNMDLAEILADREFKVRQLDAWMEPYEQAVFFNPEDVLLHQIEGRYLWLRIELETSGDLCPVIDGIKIGFPKDTWLKYLPEIYAQDRESASFLERYLGIFQSIYEDMTDEIENTPVRLNPQSADAGELKEIAGWLGVERPDIWKEDQLRYLISHAVQMNQYRGTVGFLKGLLKLYTGREPYIVERHQLEPYFDGGYWEKELKRLYSSKAYEFTVLLDVEGSEENSQEMVLRQLVDMSKPAGMECRIVILKPYIFLGQHSYLGINSILGQYKEMELNGLCAVPFTTVARK